jgi:hypothetical protein
MPRATSYAVLLDLALLEALLDGGDRAAHVLHHVHQLEHTRLHVVGHRLDLRRSRRTGQPSR